MTSILEAVQSKDLVAVKAAAAEHASALTAGAYEYDSKHAPLHLATSLGLTDIMEALLAAGAPVEALDGFGNTALQVRTRPSRLHPSRPCPSLIATIPAAAETQALVLILVPRVLGDVTRVHCTCAQTT